MPEEMLLVGDRITRKLGERGARDDGRRGGSAAPDERDSACAEPGRGMVREHSRIGEPV